MDHFTIADTLRACLPCFRATAGDSSDTEQGQRNDTDFTHIRPARSDELDALLDTDTEADAMSLHSNLGHGGRRRRMKKKQGLQLFGFNLFGKPAIHLLEDDNEPLEGSRRAGQGTSTSSFTLDSDAPVIESSAIEGLSSPPPEDALAKAERRKKRHERKELKKAARELALNAGDGDFEGFPGSGGYYPHIPEFGKAHSAVSEDSRDEFGPFRQAPERYQDDDVDAEDADLGGELYTRKTAGSSTNGSDSRSRTSGSQSFGRSQHLAAGRNYFDNGQPSPRLIPLPTSRSDASSLGALSPPAHTSTFPQEPRKKKKSSRSKSSTTSASSPSLPSPVNTSFATASVHNSSTFEGYHGEEPRPESAVRPPKLKSFPSSGLGGTRGGGRDMGAFLASR